MSSHPITSTTIASLLAASAQRYPDSLALLVPKRKPLTHKKLYTIIEDTVGILNTMGIGRNDRVALLINDNPNLITAFMAVSSAATCATLSPNSTRNEYETIFSQLRIQYLICEAESSSTTAALEAARNCNLKVIALISVEDAEAGTFRLDSEARIAPQNPGFAQPEDIALLTMSSGTTGNPKIIPVSHATYAARARRGAEAVAINADDRLLNVMPLSSVGMNHVFRSLINGGSVICLPEFDVAGFYHALDTYRPTWFSGVTTICQAIIAQSDIYESAIANHSLRFIRSGSMALPPAVMLALEQLFKIPVLEIYSSTEAGNIASNQLPPFIRKPGSVGIPQNLEVKIVDDFLNKLQPGQSGEILVRGDSVFEGYEGDPQINERAFVDGWFRTGDLGYFDQDGYLFISGRIKEVINRGGQKLSPNEVEAVLLNHPDVHSAAVFGVPDAQLGEEVASAVVLRPNSRLANMPDGAISALQGFAAEHLALYKVPRRMVLVNNIPLTAAGKIDRKRVAQLLPSLSVSSDDGSLNTPTASLQLQVEPKLIQLWAEVLQVSESRIGVHDSFQSLGGVSLSAARLIFKVREAFGINVSIVDFFNAPTVAIQSGIVAMYLQRGTAGNSPTTLIPVKPDGSRPPLYCLHALNGGVYQYREFIQYLNSDQPIYGLQAAGFDDGKTPYNDVNLMADYHFQQIKAVQIKGPYFLCGFSFGGRLALEVGRRLREAGHRDVYVLIIDDHLSASQFPAQLLSHRRLENMGVSRLVNLCFGLFRLPGHYRKLYLSQRFEEIQGYIQGKPRRHRDSDWTIEETNLLPETISAVKEAATHAAKSYIVRPYDGPLVYLRAANDNINIILVRALRYLARGPFKLIDVPGTHSTLMRDQAYIQRVAIEIEQWLASAFCSQQTN